MAAVRFALLRCKLTLQSSPRPPVASSPSAAHPTAPTGRAAQSAAKSPPPAIQAGVATPRARGPGRGRSAKDDSAAPYSGPSAARVQAVSHGPAQLARAGSACAGENSASLRARPVQVSGLGMGQAGASPRGCGHGRRVRVIGVRRRRNAARGPARAHRAGRLLRSRGIRRGSDSTGILRLPSTRRPAIALLHTCSLAAAARRPCDSYL